MARLTLPLAEYVRAYGPHVTDTPAQGWEHKPAVESTVKTHCCFCGQQCGIKLKVARQPGRRLRAVVRVSRSTKGKLCPKGVKRYLQSSHPDRLLHPLDPHRGRLPRRSSWDEALDLVVAEIRDIQAAHGENAFAMMSGVSLHQREELPDRQVRAPGAGHRATSTTTAASAWCRRAPATRRRSASTAPPTRGATSRAADVVFIAGSNVASASRSLTQLHLAGARPRREAHRRRSARHADRAHRRPVPGRPPRHRLGAQRRSSTC